ncbi:guanine nucleotide exchange factor DBS-like [Leptonychotes weddellii]|uniref:Guanine nucleotide exchange factor DBS-like n=1 Tax=Leptonychotes weddellii TaxID=9713 RepID=A0A7F8R962_LEPWE|nr:guanine nucleotide exchange factor DBS-like [Leptonychotes weddellii]
MTFSFSFKKEAVSTEPGVSSHFCSGMTSSPSGPRHQLQACEDPAPRHTSAHGPSVLLQASFPANLQLVLVLRPTGFFQRTLSDLAFKFNRDDFKMKVPVIMLSSVPELHGYIDKSQLTEDLGGTLDYSHTRWLYHRTAIEGFALMVKQTAQMLQSFGTELAETELPNDVQSTSLVLCAHTEKKDRAKEDMRSALDEGQSILENIREPLAKGGEQSLNQDQLDNQTTVQRLLAQLSETEAAFDEFWAKHQQKLQQCLQLRHFEQDFREVSGRSGGSWPWAQEAGEAAQVHPPLWAELPRSLSATRSCETQWDQTLKRVASESLPTQVPLSAMGVHFLAFLVAESRSHLDAPSPSVHLSCAGSHVPGALN